MTAIASNRAKRDVRWDVDRYTRMIEFARTADVLAGAMIPAMQHAIEMATLGTEITGNRRTLTMPVGGNPNSVRWRTGL